MKKITLVRGLPGSGKTTFARRLHMPHVEADMYFEQPGGGYEFSPAELPKAHAWCQAEARRHLQRHGQVVVSNTFVSLWEIAPYEQIAKEEKAELEVICMVGNYGSVHEVPAWAIQRMKARWEDFPGEHFM